MTVNDRGGQSGWIVPPYGPDDGDTYVGMVAYLPTSLGGPLSINPPQPGNTPNFLYAPTTHGPNGNCLETTTAYENTGSGTVAQVEWYDFCLGANGGWGNTAASIDSYFRDNYLRVFSNEASGEPEYTSEVKRLSDGRWHGFIYNYGASQWVDYYDSQGTFTNFGDGEGWNMFETHYANALSNPQPDYCSYVPTISSEGFRLKNASQGWHLVGSSEVETWEQYYNGSQPQDCWGSPSEHTYYATSYNLGNDTLWQVFSY